MLDDARCHTVAVHTSCILEYYPPWLRKWLALLDVSRSVRSRWYMPAGFEPSHHARPDSRKQSRRCWIIPYALCGSIICPRTDENRHEQAKDLHTCVLHFVIIAGYMRSDPWCRPLFWTTSQHLSHGGWVLHVPTIQTIEVLQSVADCGRRLRETLWNLSWRLAALERSRKFVRFWCPEIGSATCFGVEDRNCEGARIRTICIYMPYLIFFLFFLSMCVLEVATLVQQVDTFSAFKIGTGVTSENGSGRFPWVHRYYALHWAFASVRGNN